MKVKDPSIYRDASVIILTRGNKILLQHRDGNAPSTPNQWGVFGGGLEQGETPEETVKRECFEELRYRMQSPQLLFTYNYTKKKYGFENKSYVFVEEYDPSQKLELMEGDGMKWFTFEEAHKSDLGNLYVDLLNKVEEILKKK